MSKPFFSRRKEDQFGSFYYPLGLIEFNQSSKSREFLQRIVNGERINSQHGNKDELTQIAYEIASIFHEMRHFVDLFGSAAGCSLFLGHMEQLKRFIAVSTNLRSLNSGWQLPLPSMSERADCPVDVRRFIRRACLFNLGVDLFICAFPGVEIDGHRDDLLVELDYSRGGQVDAFPLRAGRLSRDYEMPRTVLYPIGIEALLEANAHALSRSLVESYFSEPIAKQLELRFQTFDISDDRGFDDQLVARTTTPYMIIDLMISRYLRNKGIDRFSRNLIFAITDRMLATSTLQISEVNSATTELQVDRIGTNLLKLLEEQHAELLKGGEISDTPDLMDAYRTLLSGLEGTPEWQSIEDDRSPFASVQIWEAFVVKNCIVPLLRERMATKGDCFRSVGEFLKLIGKIGLPPARRANGTLMLGSMPQRVQQAWWHQLMIGRILDQLIKGTEIFCPRAFKTFPAIQETNLAFEEDCDTHVDLGCGTFRCGEVPPVLPKCLFEDALRVSALRRGI